MTQTFLLTPRIALLATGDELIHGDILNTNAQKIALQLTALGYAVGQHMVVTDQQSEIEQAINYLLQHHQALIITGGLGPTSDDRTRFALSAVIQQALVFDETSWQAIVSHFANFKLAVHDSNRQQALFPHTAQIIANPHGTAAGCYVEYQGKIILLLPGPPKECLPMFSNAVLPLLTTRYGAGTQQVLKWRLFGVVEADIAAVLDQLTQNYSCTTGYRVDYPYLEFKLYFAKNQVLDDLIKKLNTMLALYQISPGNLKASAYLVTQLKIYPGIIKITDLATAGAFENLIATAYLREQVFFNSSPACAAVEITLTGLEELWQTTDLKINTTSLTMFIKTPLKTEQYQTAIPFRDQQYTLSYALEFIAWKIIEFIK